MACSSPSAKGICWVSCSTRLWLTAWVGNAHARAWYGRQGWRDIGATPYCFKSDGFEGESFENRVLVKDA
ncbi:MAG: hypothetical protein KA711_00515 [Ideonella sp. WA131b]|nr:hypothetical protein [Ideonella sp. WA131b]